MGLKESGLRGSLRNVSVGIDAIPDTVTSRPDDDDSFSDDRTRGKEIVLKSDWPSIGARISNNTSGPTIARLYEYDSDTDSYNEIATVDVSGLSAGDPFAFDDVDLKDGDTHAIGLDAEGSSWDVGFFSDGDDFPYEGEDLDITGRFFDGDVDQVQTQAVNDVGNPDGVLD